MIHFHITQGTLGHGRRKGLLRVLHNGNSPKTFYGMQTCGSVIQIPGKHHPDDPGTIGFGGSPKQSINGRPMEILARAAHQPDEVAIHLQVMVGRRQINVPVANFFPVSRVGDG